MRKLQLSTWVALALVVTFGLFTARPAIAADDAAAKPAALGQVGVGAVKSIDAVIALAKELGIDLPPQANAAFIEQQFPFIGKDGIATDKPLGVLYIGSTNIAPDQLMAFAIPVKPTAATIDALKTAGGKPIADHDDTLTIADTIFRRTTDYLVFGPNLAAVLAVKPEALADAIKTPDTLARIVIDVKALRETMPDQFKSIIDLYAKGVAEGAHDNKDATDVGVAPVRKAAETINQIDLMLDSSAASVRLAFGATPVKLTTATEGNLPGMPATVIARVDFNAPTSETAPDFRNFIMKSFHEGASAGKGGQPLTDDQKKLLDSAGNRAADLIFNAGATSVGIEWVGTEPIVYIVQHWKKPLDASLELRRIAHDVKAIHPEDATSVMELQTYSADGIKVLRMVASAQAGKPAGYVDMVQRDNDVYYTIATNPYRYIHHLLAAQSEGPIKGLFSGWINLGKLAEAAKAMPGSPLADMPPETQKQIIDTLHGQRLSMATSANGDVATFDVIATKALLQKLPKLIQNLSGGGAPPATAHPHPDEQPPAHSSTEQPRQ